MNRLDSRIAKMESEVSPSGVALVVLMPGETESEALAKRPDIRAGDPVDFRQIVFVSTGVPRHTEFGR